ncbi:MAG: AAA family ATPase, partial [Promethearchaeota archaeon]
MTLNSQNSNFKTENIQILNDCESPIWRIKYRPKSIKEIAQFYPATIKQLNGYIKKKNLPHLLIVGPKGSGKTVVAEILAREILEDDFSLNFKILYANDPISKEERNETKRQGRVSTKHIGSGAGQQRRYRPFIQMRVRPFVSMKKFGTSPFKILAIKNFHSLDIEQQAFRRIIEQYSKNCRMILVSDRISGIIDPIISRCQIIMIPYIPEHHFNRLLKKICDQEKIPIKLDIINFLREMSNNNIGKALDILQLTYLQYKFITLDNLSKMSREMKGNLIKELFSLTLQGNMKSIRKKLREIFRTQMISKDKILIQLSHHILQLPLERPVKAFYLELIAQNDFDSLDSAS